MGCVNYGKEAGGGGGGGDGSDGGHRCGDLLLGPEPANCRLQYMLSATPYITQALPQTPMAPSTIHRVTSSRFGPFTCLYTICCLILVCRS